MKTCRSYGVMAFMLVAALLAGLVGMVAAPTQAQAGPATVKTQLAFCVDGSGSIDGAEWALLVGGLDAAIRDGTVVPRNSTVEVCVVQFAQDYASLEVPPTVIDSQGTADAIGTAILTIPKRGGYTPTGSAIQMAKLQIINSPNFGSADRQIINLCTNGHPEPTAQVQLAIDERNAAIAAGIDEIDSEAIGVTDYWRDWLRDNIVYPEPGVIAPPYPDPPGSQGFVRPVADFSQFAEAIIEKLERIFPATLTLRPETDVNLVGEMHELIATLLDNSGNPMAGEEITFTVTSGPHAGELGKATTDANGEARITYVGSAIGTDIIVATGAGLTSNRVEKIWEDIPPPPTVPGMTEWGILATVAILATSMVLVLRRRQILT